MSLEITESPKSMSRERIDTLPTLFFTIAIASRDNVPESSWRG
jgi:hypothetical protein